MNTTRTGKIPCSIGMLTLNSAHGLPACLESVKDFAEVIICDGNSTDNTREIAEAAGAKVIRQYETDDADIPCVKDKAGLSQKNMEASTYDWHFRMDSDDTLSPEVVEEIRAIVTDPHPKYLAYRMPTRIFFEEGNSLREIKHEATYPSYTIRLTHKSVGVRFKGDVHNRPAFDEKLFPVGTMKGYYNFHWPESRVKNLWGFFRKYAGWELEVAQPSTFKNFIYWGIYRRSRTILGYILYRLPLMYGKYGFKDSMPLGMELTIVRYQCTILLGDIKKYITTRLWWVYIREIIRGKDTNRILTNMELMKKSAMGRILDIGGGGNRASHYRFLRLHAWHTITTVDINPNAKPEYVLNIEKEKLPFADQHFDYVFLMNVLEHLDRRTEVLQEIRRVLRSHRSDAGPHRANHGIEGQLIGVIPFLVNVHPDPQDFVRLTEQGLQGIFKEVGYSRIQVIPVGRGPITAGYYQLEFMLPRIVRLIVGPVALTLDALVTVISGKNLVHKFPLSYVFYASK